jgi:hypothetical protein
MPRGRILPFGLGMFTLRTGQASNVPDWSDPVEVGHDHPVTSRRLAAGVAGDVVVGQPEPVLVTEQAEEVTEPVARLPLGLHTE